MSGRKLSEAEIRSRLPVWDAIADLFLDTELDAADRERIARALARSPFPADELDAIYRYEVAPVVHGNLKVVAGEWAGFGEAWLGRAHPRVPGPRRPPVAMVGRQPPGPLVAHVHDGPRLAHRPPPRRRDAREPRPRQAPARRLMREGDSKPSRATVVILREPPHISLIARDLWRRPKDLACKATRLSWCTGPASRFAHNILRSRAKACARSG